MSPLPRHHGFTLTEIMIVVTIIGILATLAIPVARRLRNTAIEKTLFADAHAISSAFTRAYGEENLTSTTLGNLIGTNKYITGLSAGTLVAQGAGSVSGATFTNDAFGWSSASGLGILLSDKVHATGTECVIRLGNALYDTSMSALTQVTAQDQGAYSVDPTNKDIGLIFSVETGELLKKTATSPDQIAAYGK